MQGLILPPLTTKPETKSIKASLTSISTPEDAPPIGESTSNVYVQVAVVAVRLDMTLVIVIGEGDGDGAYVSVQSGLVTLSSLSVYGPVAPLLVVQ